MSAAAAIETLATPATAPPKRTRLDLLLDNEIANVQASHAALPPAAIACLQKVLESILREDEIPPATALAARRLLHAISAGAIVAATPVSHRRST